MIGIINLGTNNLNCIIKICKRLKREYKIINNNEDYNQSINKLIIPGIGNYYECMNNIKTNKLDEIIISHLKSNKKIMGICIGMQILSSRGEEKELTIGLDILQRGLF